MSKKLRGRGDVSFGIYFNRTSTTSGQRFFCDLLFALERWLTPLSQRPEAILFNVSAPLSAIVLARLRWQRVVLRIDGFYFDRISPAFLRTIPGPVRPVVRLLGLHPRFHNAAAFLANLANRNYGLFLRILLSHSLICQSAFSAEFVSRYFPFKTHRTIVNGTRLPLCDRENERVGDGMGGIRLVTIHDERASKRIPCLIDFVRWANEVKDTPITLTLVGYTGRFAKCVEVDYARLVKELCYIHTMPPFSDYNVALRRRLADHDMYITFTYRDACPNAVIEAMAHGLPVVATRSGGLPDIVQDAGILHAVDDYDIGLFAPHRFEPRFPAINWQQVLDDIQYVYDHRSMFSKRVRSRFENDLSIDVVARRYCHAVTDWPH